MVDIAVEHHGSLFLLQPLTEQAFDWLRQHVDEGGEWVVSALVVEPRDVFHILRRALEDGLQIR